MGERILIDTDVLIDYVKGELNLPYDKIWCISEITLYEFIRGCKNPKEAKNLLESEFEIIWIDNDIILKASEIWKKLKEKGMLIDDRDLIIGSTAIVRRIPLLTKNKRHFERLKEFGLVLFK